MKGILRRILIWIKTDIQRQYSQFSESEIVSKRKAISENKYFT